MPEQPKIQFTPAQAAAISARGGSLLVSAAAGSGKTRVLVERVVGLITDPVHPVDANQLLIMTFTNAAAAKLRADITTRLAQEVRAHPGDLHLRSQQLLLQRASIGTVDAFCLHFVQQHFAMLDVPPDFETADEADLARIEQETLAATLETAYQDPDFRAFADLYDRGRTDNTAGDAILVAFTNDDTNGTFKVSVSNATQTGVTAVTGDFTNIGKNFADYASASSDTPITPLTYGAETEDGAEVLLTIRSLNEQSFALDSENRINDNAVPVLVIDSEIKQFVLGTQFDFEMTALDVCDSSISSSDRTSYYKTNPAEGDVVFENGALKVSETTGEDDEAVTCRLRITVRF